MGYEDPKEIAKSIMREYYNFIIWEYDGSFRVWLRENAIAQ
ncbi:MAG: hypothetical protein ACP5TO_04485 [Thermoplasmata archaeon]